MTRTVLEKDVLIICCAVSAGIHAALIREHWAEGRTAGLGFAVSTALLGVFVVWLTRRSPAAPWLLCAVCLVLTGLIGAYVAAVTTGVPQVHPDVEPVDALAVVTKAFELTGLVVALRLLPLRREQAQRRRRTLVRAAGRHA